jgi:hypothetical protein
MSFLFRKIPKKVITLVIEGYDDSREPLDDYMGRRLALKSFFIFRQPSKYELMVTIDALEDEAQVVKIFSESGLKSNISDRVDMIEYQYGPPQYYFSVLK